MPSPFRRRPSSMTANWTEPLAANEPPDALVAAAALLGSARRRIQVARRRPLIGGNPSLTLGACRPALVER
eukprot:8645024-Pyramimonas_sp.AAC.1